MFFHRLAKIIYPFVRTMNFLKPFGDLIARLWIANVFFSSGLLKLESWSSTIALFEQEYQVPILSPEVAAVIGTAAELILPVLLVIGLGGRFWIFALFVYNVVAAASYPFLWTPEGYNGLQQHVCWGLLLMMLMFHGSGKISLDYWLHRKYGYLFLKKPQK